ncbi:pyruvate kinase [Tabrizicola sp. J26]|uniref:pyruvate kinase n=1 Tax=Alitabrizicola rongguiensis TaxID=2909234 RepID=UPI001F42D01E|nr:pyruvate kinase [Tabrizicola rongguiensis]MCF1708538.1 pyruvate kinase [Tabrizicola rongguiensis]
MTFEAASALTLRREQARELLADLRRMRKALVADSDRRMAQWGPGIRREAFRSSALNLADWLALRRMDLTALQPRLTEFGLSTLGRLDGHVRPSVDAVIAALAAIAGEAEPVFPLPEAISGERALLDARRDELFGSGTDGPQTRVMVTLPSEAAEDPDLIRDLVLAGMDCARINCAHDGPDIWRRMIGKVRLAAGLAGRRVPVSMDLGGPKFRIETVSKDHKHRFLPGDRFAIAAALSDGPHKTVCTTLSHPALLEALEVGSEISIDDGKLWAKVVERPESHALLEVTHSPAKGMRIKPEKGVNLPGSDLRVSALTEDDIAALDVVVTQADMVSYSFVQTVGDIRALIEEMEKRADDGRMPAIILKIETPLGLRNLPDLIVEAGGRLPVGVMIARGDLAVEIGFERLSEVQEEILWLCEAAQVPVIWATQVLEGMVRDGQASRAEVTDAAMGQRAECVMLNKGPHVVEAVRFLRGILGRMDRHQMKKSARLVQLKAWGDGS